MIDTLIKNGTVADGVSGELYMADVAIRDDIIIDIAPSIPMDQARDVVDAKGKIVAPGFVDVHSHSDYYLMIDHRARSKILQGVTTEVGGNCGYSAAPMSGEIRERRVADYEKQFPVKVDWANMEEFLTRLADNRPEVNYAALIGYNTVRGSTLGPNSSKPGVDGMKRLKTMIAEGLDQGAFGMSVGIVYPPACFADADEFAEVFRVVAERDKVFTSHIRSEGARLLEALDEVTKIAERSGARLQVSHLKTAGKDNWKKLDRAFEILESAMSDGVKIMADRYPYLASNTGLQVVLPDRAFDGGRDNLIAMLKTSAERDAFRRDILANHPEPEYWETVMVSQVVTEKNRDLEGLTVAEGAALRGKDPFDFIFDLLAEENGDVEAIYFCMNEDNLERILRKPYVVVGSDAGARAVDGALSIGRPHPRTFGTFPKFFKEFVREKKLFSIPEAVRKTSTAACEFFGIARRGAIVKQYFADVVIFDPETIGDTATYKNPLSYPTGVLDVFVNGAHAVKNGAATDKRAGKALSAK